MLNREQGIEVDDLRSVPTAFVGADWVNCGAICQAKNADVAVSTPSACRIGTEHERSDATGDHSSNATGNFFYAYPITSFKIPLKARPYYLRNCYPVRNQPYYLIWY